MSQVVPARLAEATFQMETGKHLLYTSSSLPPWDFKSGGPLKIRNWARANPLVLSYSYFASMTASNFIANGTDPTKIKTHYDSIVALFTDLSTPGETATGVSILDTVLPPSRAGPSESRRQRTRRERTSGRGVLVKSADFSFFFVK